MSIRRNPTTCSATKMPRLALVALLAVPVIAAGCQQTAKINPTAGGGGLTGTWFPDGGGYTARFDNGAFTSIATDTSSVISQGSYVVISAESIELTWQSNVTGLANSASCDRPDVDRLDCTDASGRTFILIPGVYGE